MTNIGDIDIFLKLPNSKTLQKAQIISTQKSRMGGSISHLKLLNETEAFLKIGTGFERLEIQREHENINALTGRISVPNVIDFQDLNSIAYLTTEKANGLPLHEACQSWNDEKKIHILADIITTLWKITDIVPQGKILNGLENELDDVALLIERNLINIDDFKKASAGVSPNDTYQEIKLNIKQRNPNALAHGDFCLPNIIIDENDKWTLIDLGKAGMTDKYRDLSTIQQSLVKNIGDGLFENLLEHFGMDIETVKKETATYDLIDEFWHNAIL